MATNLPDKKNCAIDTCTNLTPAEKDKDVEEKEIKTIDLCNDTVCANVHEKKLVDMSQGLSQLENILKNMTGLCREPKCVSKSPSVQLQIEENRFTLPQPNRYFTEDFEPLKGTEVCKAKKGQECPSNKYARPESKKICTADPETKYPRSSAQEDEYAVKKICKGSVCYNALMGYTFDKEKEKKEPHVCDSFSCIPKPKPEKKICGAAICPFSKEKPEPPRFSLLEDFDTTPKTKTGPCGGFECYSTSDKFPSLSTGKPRSNVFDTFASYAAPKASIKPLDIGNTNRQYSNAPMDLCGRPSCPFASTESRKMNTPEGSTGAICPNTKCPYNKKMSSPSEGPAVGLCGRSSCPYAVITTSLPTQTLGIGRTPGSNIANTTYTQVGVCGQAECPMSDKTSPGAIQPCPYADKVKRYPCGSPSCPYVNPSGMLRTHEYGNDKSFVQEAARPYCGSASPYDYMSSITPSYPSPYATNYPLFPYTEPSSNPPCPFLPKKQKKSCGSPTCPYTHDNRKYQQQKDNFCVEKTCPFQEGVCGTQRILSCDGSNIDICGSPDCPVPPSSLQNEPEICCCCGRPKDVPEAEPDIKKKKTCCLQSEPQKIIPERDICGDPDCKPKKKKKKEICGNMECFANNHRRASDATTKSLYDGSFGSGYQQAEEGYEEKVYPGKCSSKTCPYLKKLVFCDDCGGVLPDEDTPSSSYTSYESGDAQEESVSYESKQDASKIEESPSAEIKQIKAKKDDDKPPSPKAAESISLYSYPGVQIGHKECGNRIRKIPKNMGWLWNVLPAFGNPELWRGYKPGAICKTVYKIIMKHRQEFDPNAGKKKRSRSKVKIDDTKHCIEVKKREGDYHIVVNPVKDPKERGPMENPYMDVTPIQFKVEKKKENEAYCPCDENSDAASEASTEFDFHFTPPAAVPDPVRKTNKVFSESGAQYDVMDLPPELRGRTSGSKRSHSKSKKGKKKKK